MLYCSCKWQPRKRLPMTRIGLWIQSAVEAQPKVWCDMVHAISEIVDFLLAQVQRNGASEPNPGRPDRGRNKLDWPRPADDLRCLPAPGPGLNPASVIDLISQDMLSEAEIPLYFPVRPVEMNGLVCHRLLVLSEPGLPPLVLTVYYHPGYALNIEQPRYVVDNDIWVEPSGQFWSFISVVAGSGDQARNFIETFINRLGFQSSFEVTEEGDRLTVARIRCH